MINFNTCNLKIVFKFNECNSKLMKVEVDCGHSVILEPVDKYAVFEQQIELPKEVIIRTSGKNHRYDTKMDAAGNIYEDLSVQIESISLDSIELNEKYLHQKINILTENGEIFTTSYIGFNGVINLNFSEDNTFTQVLKANS